MEQLFRVNQKVVYKGRTRYITKVDSECKQLLVYLLNDVSSGNDNNWAKAENVKLAPGEPTPTPLTYTRTNRNGCIVHDGVNSTFMVFGNSIGMNESPELIELWTDYWVQGEEISL